MRCLSISLGHTPGATAGHPYFYQIAGVCARKLLKAATARCLILFSVRSFSGASDRCRAGRLSLEVSNMSEKLISRRGAFSLLGLGAALGFAVPTTMLMESDAEAQMQPTAPAPSAPAPTTQPMPGMQQGQEQPTGGKKRRQARHNARTGRREARHNARTGRREARHTGRTQRREARGKSDKLYMKGNTTKQQ